MKTLRRWMPQRMMMAGLMPMLRHGSGRTAAALIWFGSRSVSDPSSSWCLDSILARRGARTRSQLVMVLGLHPSSSWCSDSLDTDQTAAIRFWRKRAKDPYLLRHKTGFRKLQVCSHRKSGNRLLTAARHARHRLGNRCSRRGVCLYTCLHMSIHMSIDMSIYMA